MKTLTEKQKYVLEFIRSYISYNGFPPTNFEISKHFGWSSDNAANEHIKTLSSKGAISMARGVARGIKIIGEGGPDPAKMEQALRDIITVSNATQNAKLAEFCERALT